MFFRLIILLFICISTPIIAGSLEELNNLHGYDYELKFNELDFVKVREKKAEKLIEALEDLENGDIAKAEMLLKADLKLQRGELMFRDNDLSNDEEATERQSKLDKRIDAYFKKNI